MPASTPPDYTEIFMVIIGVLWSITTGLLVYVWTEHRAQIKDAEKNSKERFEAIEGKCDECRKDKDERIRDMERRGDAAITRVELETILERWAANLVEKIRLMFQAGRME